MKTTIFSIALAFASVGAFAQNQNVTNVTKTTVTTVKDSEGEKKLVRDENIKTVQNIEFENADSKALNKDVKPSPVQMTSTVEITGPDGRKRTVDVDRSAYYSLGGDRYKMSVDNTGYTLSDPKGQRAALLRQMSTPNTYIYRTKDKTSVGHFDSNGNLILETYDDKTDKITVETFSRSNP